MALHANLSPFAQAESLRKNCPCLYKLRDLLIGRRSLVKPLTRYEQKTKQRGRSDLTQSTFKHAVGSTLNGKPMRSLGCAGAPYGGRRAAS